MVRLVPKVGQQLSSNLQNMYSQSSAVYAGLDRDVLIAYT